MRSLNPTDFVFDGNGRVNDNTPSEYRLLAASRVRQSAAKPSCAFEPNSWLSREDACLLLRNQVSVAAKLKDYAQAAKLLDRLIVYEPGKADHYANRGLMHYLLEQVEKALADYDQALEIDSALDKVYNNRANLQAARQNWEAAIADYDRAIDINPLNLRARINQAITFREMGSYAEALACLDIAMFFRPNSAVLHATLYAERGRTYHLQGDWNCAIAEYNKALLRLQASHSNSPQNVPADCARSSKLTHRVLTWMNSLL